MHSSVLTENKEMRKTMQKTQNTEITDIIKDEYDMNNNAFTVI